MNHWYSAGDHCRHEGRECLILSVVDRGICGLGFQELHLLELGTEKRWWAFAEDCEPILHIVARGTFPRLVWSEGQHV